MSEHEFDAYLALLGGMLGLSDEQREAISGELRDHMIERMHEQMAAGMPRNEAIQQALAEFGDASRLAAGLAAAATLHRRRLIMRWTFGTVVTFGLLLFVALAYWPAGENGPGPQAVIGQQENDKTQARPDDLQPIENSIQPVSVEDDLNEAAFLALQQSIDVDTTTSDMPLEQLITDVAEKVGLKVEFLLPKEAAEAESMLNANVSIKLQRMPAMTVLRKIANGWFDFGLRDGVLTVSSQSPEASFLRLYPLRAWRGVEETDSPIVSPGAELSNLVMERQRLLLAGKSDEAERFDKAIVAAAELLVRDAQTRSGQPKIVGVIQSVVTPDQWDINGGPYSIQTYGDVLIVSASLSVHWEITQTLARLWKHLGPQARPERPATPLGQQSPVAVPYVIEPPDVLSISVLKTVPKPPYKLRPFDVIIIRVVGVFEELGQPIAEAYSIQPDGTVDLGPTYGKVKVVDRSVEEATVAIEEHLRQFVEAPKVAVSLAAASEVEQVRGQHLVGPDGRVNLGSYGQVYVSGKTLVEAKAAIEEKLAEKLQDPEAIVDVVAYNSKVYYIITQGNGTGDNVVRVPITGNETVLDALSNIGGVKRASCKKIWISRPAPNGVGVAQELPVDFEAITQDGITVTNHQILPGDRIFIDADNPEGQDEQIPPQAIR